MPQKRKPHHPLPNWQSGVDSENIERWKPRVNPEPAPVRPSLRSEIEILTDELSKGCTPLWMMMLRIRSQQRKKWGNRPVNRHVVEHETRRLLLEKAWRYQ